MSYRTTVYDREIMSLFDRSQPVADEARRIGARILTVATATAPRSGLKVAWGIHPASEHLFSKHRARGYLRAGPYNVQFPVENTASYADYVHEGTLDRPPVGLKGDLYAEWGELHLRGGEGRKAYWDGQILIHLGKTVKGQKANPWLKRAGEYVAATSAY